MSESADQRWIGPDGVIIDETDRGLVYDLQTLVNRRSILGLFGGIGAASLLAACGGSSSGAGSASPASPASTSAAASAAASSAASSAAASSGTSSGTLTEVPAETQGPYPGDGSNGPNVLDDSGIVRRDIRSSFGSSTTTAPGVPLTVQLTLRSPSTGQPVTGAAVYAWHCDRAGLYSLYSDGLTGENYLRGVQEADSSGTVTFQTIFPGCYRGRWPHIHFEVYAKLADATGAGPIVRTSQIALPEATCKTVYAVSGYEASVPNFAGITLATDMVFSDDGGVHQLATMTGDATTGYTAALTVGI